MVLVYTLAATSSLLWGRRAMTFKRNKKRQEFITCLATTAVISGFWIFYLGWFDNIDKTSAIIAAVIFIIYYLIFRED